MPFRFGRDADGWQDLPTTPDIQVGSERIGSSFRGVSGALNSSWSAVKRTWPLQLQGSLGQTRWMKLWQMFRKSPGPYFLLDSTAPNLLAEKTVVGQGWQSAAGVAVPTPANMRLLLNATYLTVQTARTTTPVLADLIPVTPGVALTLGFTVYVPAAFSGSVAVYGYTGPSGSGVLQGSLLAVTTSGRKAITFTPGVGIVYIAIRAVRATGDAQVWDWVQVPGTDDQGPAVVAVEFTAIDPVHNRARDRESTISMTLTEV